MKGYIIVIVLLFSFGTTCLKAQNDSISQITISHSPGKAALFSTVVPGLGQIYNKQVWKTPIVYVGLGTLIYFAIDNYNNMDKFKTEYYNRLNGTGKLLSNYTTYSNESIYSLYEAYKDNFHLYTILSVAFYALQILDAYVYGHLFSFDISDDLALTFAPSFIPLNFPTVNKSFALSLSLQF
ncbi:MAG: DUF5683 domain-containing protein [Bacteroidota bacterium]|nr:DUF5683 domain-containing protein [Bacteroidota bacterium]